MFVCLFLRSLHPMFFLILCLSTVCQSWRLSTTLKVLEPFFRQINSFFVPMISPIKVNKLNSLFPYRDRIIEKKINAVINKEYCCLKNVTLCMLSEEILHLKKIKYKCKLYFQKLLCVKIKNPVMNNEQKIWDNLSTYCFKLLT